MDQELIIGIGGLILGAIATAVGAWYKFRGGIQIANQEFIEKLLDECEELRSSLSKRDSTINLLQDEVRRLHHEVSALKIEIQRYESTRVPSDSAQLLETVMNSFHLPMWIHEVGANNWFINDSYCEIFSVPRKDFWTPINLFRFYPVKLSAQFVGNDMAIIESGVGRYLEEDIPLRIMEPPSDKNPPKKWQVVKIPVRAGGRDYVFGFCSDSNRSKTVVEHYKQVTGN
jgi:hypothetical protein